LSVYLGATQTNKQTNNNKEEENFSAEEENIENG
jgi:hypothetical protein